MDEFVAGKCGRDFSILSQTWGSAETICGYRNEICPSCKRILELEAQLIDIKDLATRYDQAPVDTKDRPESWRRLDNLLIAAREGPVDE